MYVNDGSWGRHHGELPPTARKLEANGPVKAEVVPSAHSAVATALPLFIIYADSLETDEILHACVKSGADGKGGQIIRAKTSGATKKRTK